MINFLSSPLWFSHFCSLSVILSYNCPALCSLFLNSLPTYNNLFDLPFPLISSWPPFCILLLMPILFFNYFVFLILPFLLPSVFIISISFIICNHAVVTFTFATSLFPLLFSSPLFLRSTGPEYILDATSTVCYATHSKLEPLFNSFVSCCSQWSNFVHFCHCFLFTLHSCLSSLCKHLSIFVPHMFLSLLISGILQ